MMSTIGIKEKDLQKVVKALGGIAVHYVDSIYNVVLPETHGEWYIQLVSGAGWNPGTACRIVKGVQGTAGGTVLAVRDVPGLKKALEVIRERGGQYGNRKAG